MYNVFHIVRVNSTYNNRITNYPTYHTLGVLATHKLKIAVLISIPTTLAAGPSPWNFIAHVQTPTNESDTEPHPSAADAAQNKSHKSYGGHNMRESL